MISEKVIKAILRNADNENKNVVLLNLFEHLSRYDYNNDKQGHILEMLVDTESIVNTSDIDIKYIEENFNKLFYNPDNEKVMNITIERINNIDCDIIIGFDINRHNDEDDNDIIEHRTATTNFLSFPEMLKKS